MQSTITNPEVDANFCTDLFFFTGFLTLSKHTRILIEKEKTLKGVTMRYPVVVHKSEYGYDVHCPLLPGCHSQGDTIDEALENIKDAIRTYLEMVTEEEKGSLYEVEVAL